MASAAVRVALERMGARQRYWGDGQRATLLPAPGGLRVRYMLAEAEGECARHSEECAIAEIALGVRALSGQFRSPGLVRFRHPAPHRTEEHREVFPCPVELGAAVTEMDWCSRS